MVVYVRGLSTQHSNHVGPLQAILVAIFTCSQVKRGRAEGGHVWSSVFKPVPPGLVTWLVAKGVCWPAVALKEGNADGAESLFPRHTCQKQNSNYLGMLAHSHILYISNPVRFFKCFLIDIFLCLIQAMHTATVVGNYMNVYNILYVSCVVL